MKQIIQSYRTGELWLAEVPLPAVKAGQVLVRTEASLVSAGTEKMIVGLAKKSLLGKARARPDLVKQVIAKIKTEGLGPTMTKVFAKLDTPMPLGYSCAGEVVEVGSKISGQSGISSLSPGDRVACGGAGYATHAQYNVIPANLCVKLPKTVSTEDAASATVGSIAMQGVRQADLRLGERVVVIGLGLIGLMAVQLLKASGCQVLGSDLDPAKCALAKELGADEAVSSDLEQVCSAFTEGNGADAVLITAATPSNGPIELAAQISRMRGRVVVVGMVGMDIPRDPFYKKELDLRLSMSYGPGRYDPEYEEGGHDYPIGYVRWTEQRNMAAFVQLIANGSVTPGKLITHRFDIDNALDAYALLQGKTPDGQKPNYLGIVIHYPHDADTPPPTRTVALGSSVKSPVGQASRLSSAGTADPLADPLANPLADSLPQSNVSSPTQATTSSPIAIGFIGAGNFTKGVLFPAIKRIENTTLVGLCSATGMSAVETGKKHNFQYATTDYEKLLQDDQINTIFVTTPHHTHARFAIAAIKAGKHVFLEKPLCLDMAQIGEYEKALQAYQGKASPCLMVGFNRRFSPHTRRIQDAFANRATPMVVNYRINAGIIPKDHWIQDPHVGGGRIVGEACHFVDFCQAVIHANPTRVFAASIQTRDARFVSEDSVIITIQYDDGSLATIQYLAHGHNSLPKERVEIFSDQRCCVLDDFCSTKFFGGGKNLRSKQNKGFGEELITFFHCINQGSDWPIAFDVMASTTRVTFAALESLRTGQPIPLG